MPTLGESFAAIVDALAAQYGPPAPLVVASGLGDPFAAMVAVLLARGADPPRVARALEALRDACLLDPQALAETDLAESEDVLKSGGTPTPARGLAPIQRLSRWIVERHH